MEKFKEVDALTIIHSLRKSSGTEYVSLQDIADQASAFRPSGDQVIFRFLHILELLQVIQRSPSDRYSYKIIGSIGKWEPSTPDYAEFDIERIITWLRSHPL